MKGCLQVKKHWLGISPKRRLCHTRAIIFMPKKKRNLRAGAKDQAARKTVQMEKDSLGCQESSGTSTEANLICTSKKRSLDNTCPQGS